MTLLEALTDLAGLELFILNTAFEIGVSEEFESKPFKRLDLLDKLAEDPSFAIDKYRNFNFFRTLIELEVLKKSKGKDVFKFTNKALRIISMLKNKQIMSENNYLHEEISRNEDRIKELQQIPIEYNKLLARLGGMLSTEKANIKPVDYDRIMNIFKPYEGGAPQ
ncbi:hypothetical protein L2729_00580 [Shewanella gelidimarina]|uniref:hypothetical protein n=1 Tax=Shewanella gelidimarina TaxID=56813 RepID=UPI00200DF536|nr:hypothetical protein [Shewanella gelidimarina]MCL1056485.1 hypothetical protein [Shewanella gelidimarina]